LNNWNLPWRARQPARVVPLARVRHRLVLLVPLLLAIAAVLWHLRAFLPPRTLPMRSDAGLPFTASDLTPQWAPWLRVAADALWRHGTLPFWNPFTNSGSPQFEVPEAGVIGLATLLAGVAPIEAALKWSVLAHVIAGMCGTYALARRLRVGPAFAALGAYAFGTGTYFLDHLRLGHLSHVAPMGIAPWAMLCLWKALDDDDAWWMSAIGGGVLMGVAVLEGGSGVVVYTIVAFALLPVACIGRDATQRFKRLLAVGAIAAACFAGIAAPQLLPMLTYIPLTGRSGGLSLAQSMTAIKEVAHPAATTMAWVLMGLGFGALWVNGQRRAALWLAAVVMLGVQAARDRSVYEFLWRNVPGFRFQRIPERAMMLAGLAGPPLVAAGAHGLWRLLAQWRNAGAVLASVAFAFMVHEAWTMAPDTPPMVDPRIEQQQNHAMRWLVDHADGTRIHIWESPTRHWGADNITVPLRLESITSYTTTEHRDYLPGDFDPPNHRTYLGDSYQHQALFWGLLNTRYILSGSRLTEPGLKLAARVERCPVKTCQPAKSAGPFVYENTRVMPRAWVVRNVIAIVGEPRPAFEAALDVMGTEGFDPTRFVVLQFERGAAVPPADVVFAVNGPLPGAVRWESADRADALADLLKPRAAQPIDAANMRRVSTNRLEIAAPADGWLVMSEKFALFPGWTASIKKSNAALVRANGVMTATKVRAGDMVRASYEPPRLRPGVALFVATIAAIVVVARRTRRRDARRPVVVMAGTSPIAAAGYQAV
jgi:hypothetical protein